MFAYIWPLVLVVLSNTLYQICTKSVPSNMSPLASLTITYGVGMVFSLIMFLVLTKNPDLIGEYKKVNWAPIALGLSVVGLEVGFIYMYKAGWPVSIAQIVPSVLLAVLLVFIGAIFYKEHITWNKIVGVLVCLAGLGLINFK